MWVFHLGVLLFMIYGSESHPLNTDEESDEFLRPSTNSAKTQHSFKVVGNRHSPHNTRMQKLKQQAKDDHKKAEEFRNRFLAQKAQQKKWFDDQAKRQEKETDQVRSESQTIRMHLEKNEQRSADDENTWRFNVNIPEVLDSIKTYTGFSIRGNDSERSIGRDGSPSPNSDPWSKVYTVEVKPDFDKVVNYIKNIFGGRRSASGRHRKVNKNEKQMKREGDDDKEQGEYDCNDEETPKKVASCKLRQERKKERAEYVKYYNLFPGLPGTQWPAYVEEGLNTIKGYPVIYPAGYYKGRILHLVELKKQKAEREKKEKELKAIADLRSRYEYY